LLELDRKLPAILKREAQLADAREGLALAQLCEQYKRLNAASVRLYADAITAEPKLVDDPRAPHRYEAARAAALAAACKGEDAAKLGGEGRARLRGQALGWLRALAAWVEKGTPQVRSMAKPLADIPRERLLRAPQLTVRQILAWADAHHHRTARCPTKDSGPVAEAGGDTWRRINDALARGNRGLPGGVNLSQPLRRRRRIAPRGPWRLQEGRS
jgi:hypothetical protein